MKLHAVTPGPRYAPLMEMLAVTESILDSAEVFFRRYALTSSQFNVLNLLQDAPDRCLPMHEMADRLLIHRSNVTLLVDKLEKAGLVRREAHPTDRRSWRVMLTPKGWAKVSEVLPEYYRLAEELWGDIPPTEAAEIAGRLETLRVKSGKIRARFEPNRSKSSRH